jgi:transposase
MKKPSQHLITEVPRKRGQVELTIGIDLGDVWSHYCTLNQQGEVIDRGRFRTTPKAIEKWFVDVPHARVAMEAGVHSIWISEQLQELGHEVLRTYVSCGRFRTATVRAIKSMPRSWHAMRG